MFNYEALYQACNTIKNRCIGVSSPRLYDACMRVFQDSAARAVTFKVNINLVGDGYATINRDGSFTMSTQEPEC